MPNTTTATREPGWATFDDLADEYGPMLDEVTQAAYWPPQPSRFAAANSQLSRALTALRAEWQRREDMVVDAWRFGAPAEVANSVWDGLATSLNTIAQQWGFNSADEVWQVVCARTSYRQAYDLLCMYTH